MYKIHIIIIKHKNKCSMTENVEVYFF